MQAPPTKLFKLILPFLMRNAIFDTCRDSLPFGWRCSNFIDYTKVLSFDPDQIYFFLINKSELDRIYPTILNAIISYLRNFQFLILNFFFKFLILIFNTIILIPIFLGYFKILINDMKILLLQYQYLFLQPAPLSHLFCQHRLVSQAIKQRTNLAKPCISIKI